MIDQEVRWFAHHPADLGDDFFDNLQVQMQASLDFGLTHPDAGRFSRSVLAKRGRPIFAAVVERFGFDPESELGALVAHHHALGLFRTELSLEFVQRAVLLVVNHTRELLDLDHPVGLGLRLDELIAFLRHGLTTQDPGDL